MRVGRYLPILFSLAVCLQAADFDVIVVSGSSGGFGAALAAGRMGARVALIEDTPVLGGMLSNGVSNIDTYSYESLSGIFEEFRHRVQQYYRPMESTDPIFQGRPAARRPMDYRGRQSNAPLEGGRWEPHVADRIFKEMMAAVPGVTIFYNTWATGVEMHGNRIAGVAIRSGGGPSRVLRAAVVIDATHEGDIAAWAGAPFRVGREARSPLEPHAGGIFFFNGTGEIMEASTPGQDDAVVSYGLRLCLKHYPEGTAHLLASPPPGYDPAGYRHAPAHLRPSMPGGKTEMNENPIGNEMQEVNWEWPTASRARRQKLYELYRDHALGYLYYLQHERGLREWGLPDDEFAGNAHLPYRVFVREARRIEGDAMMTEADVNPFITGRDLMPPLRANSIAIGHYAIDSKPVKQKRDFSTPDKGSGDFFLADVAAPFQVPYGAIVPRNVEGLLVPVAMSATHVAFSAVRMDPTWMAMGQAAGVAAVLSLRHGVAPRAVPVDELQHELLRQKARLLFYWDLPLDHPAFEAIQWLSLHHGLEGDARRLFHPDEPLTRAEAARMVVRVLGVWPSVSNFHFTDVAWNHPAFREIETLFDHRLLAPFGIGPRWPSAGGYDAARNSGFARAAPAVEFHPEAAVSRGEFSALVHAVANRPAPLEDPRRTITRGEAAMLLYASTGR